MGTNRRPLPYRAGGAFPAAVGVPISAAKPRPFIAAIHVRVLLGFGAFGAFWGVWGAALPQVQRHSHVDDSRLGTALLFVGVGALLSIRLVGGLADRWPQATLPYAVAALSVAGALPAMVVGVAGLSMTLLILGVCSGATDAAINAAAARTGRPSVLFAVASCFSSSLW
jgi:predicted MFS family arabinose efflux permease